MTEEILNTAQDLQEQIDGLRRQIRKQKDELEFAKLSPDKCGLSLGIAQQVLNQERLNRLYLGTLIRYRREIKMAIERNEEKVKELQEQFDKL